jgi:hypothetical protein
MVELKGFFFFFSKTLYQFTTAYNCLHVSNFPNFLNLLNCSWIVPFTFNIFNYLSTNLFVSKVTYSRLPFSYSIFVNIFLNAQLMLGASGNVT